MADDLTDRLRKYANNPAASGYVPLHFTTVRMCADRIDALTARIAALEAENGRLRELESGACAMLEVALGQVQRLEAERDALRATLRDLEAAIQRAGSTKEPER